MTQVLDEFEQLLEESFAKSNSVADIVEGTVIKKESEGYLVSVKGAKMEAFLSNKELSSDVEELEIGEVREFYVLKDNTVTVKESVTKTMLNDLDKNGTTNYPTLTFTAYAVQRDSKIAAIDTAKEAWEIASTNNQ